jgi:hypothetical protein
VGTGRCKLHGGSTPTHTRGAQAEELNRSASAAVAQLKTLVGPAAPISDPLHALALLAGEVWRFKDVLAAHVAELEDIRYRSVTGEQLRGEIAAFGHALDRCNTVLVAIAKLNIDDRMVAIQEQQQTAIVAAIEAGLAEAGIQGVTAVRARQATSRHLRLIGGGVA